MEYKLKCHNCDKRIKVPMMKDGGFIGVICCFDYMNVYD